MKLPIEAPEMRAVMERVEYTNHHYGIHLYRYITSTEHTQRWTADALPGKWFATYPALRHAVTNGLHTLFSLTLSGAPMKIGQTQPLIVVAKDASGNVITDPAQLTGIGYTDDASTVANVDANGVVTGKTLGTADFTATITRADGVVVTSNELTLTVGAGDIATLELSAGPAADPAVPTPPAPVATLPVVPAAT